MFKRELAVLLSIIFILSGVPSAFASDEMTTIEKQLDVLVALDIIDEKDAEELNLFDYISKIEFIGYICGMMGFDDGLIKNKSDCITYAYNLGIISSTEGNDVTLKYNEALTMLVRAAGYEIQAISSGGFPTGYIAIAGRLGITKNTSGTAEGYVKKHEAITMIYNMFDVQISHVETMDNDGILYSYDRREKETFLSAYRNIFKVEGVLEATESVALRSNVSTRKDCIVIDGEEYEGSASDDLLGRNVMAYVERDEDTLRLKAITENTNEVLSIEGAEVVMVSADLSKLTYASNNKNKTANISAAAAFIYNGLPYDGDSNLDFKPEDGNIELIDNNNDGIYDVVFIQSYKTVVVDYVSEFAEMIQGIYAYDPENIAVNLNSENGESIISIVSGDKLLLPEDIERLDVLRILEAENGAKRKVTVELSRETVRGSVAEIADKNSETVLYVDGRELVLSATFKKAIEKGDVNAKKISIGKQYNFHLDSTGKVAYATELDSALTYAIVKSTCSLDGIDPVYMIKVFTQDGEWMELTLSDKIMYNGERINAEAAIQDLNLAVQTGSSITVIGYELDKEGKIKTMEAAIENCSDSERLNSQTNLSCIYRSHNNSLNSQLFIAESPIVWTVLSDKMGEDDSYSISSIGSIFTEGWGYDVSVYDIDEYGFAQILVVYLTEDFYSLRNDERQVFVVDGVGEALLPDGTIGQQVTGGMGGYENLKFYLEDEEIAADLCPGDVISVFLDKNGNLLSLDKYYSFKNDGFSYKTASDLWISLAILQGRILKYDIERKFIEIDCGDNNWIVRTSVVPSVLIYNTSRGTVEKGTLDDLVQGSFVVAKINYFKLISIVVIV